MDPRGEHRLLWMMNSIEEEEGDGGDNGGVLRLISSREFKLAELRLQKLSNEQAAKELLHKNDSGSFEIASFHLALCFDAPIELVSTMSA